MPGLVKDRYRNQTVSFRVSPEERRQLEARIMVSGLAKSMYFRHTFLRQDIKITVGKWQSDRLSIELRRLRELIEALDSKEDDDTALALRELLGDLKAVLNEVQKITAAQPDKGAE